MRKLYKAFFIAVLLVSCIVTSPSLKNDVQAAETPIEIGINPTDVVLDPAKPVVYMTKQGERTIYSVDYETGVVKSLKLPYPAERLDIYKDKLYVTQPKISHNSTNFGPYSGSIAEVDTVNFTLDNLIETTADPYDIAIDENGFIYITPGSGQFQSMKVYSINDKKEIENNGQFSTVRHLSTVYYNKEFSKLYTIPSESNSFDMQAYEVRNGIINYSYYSSLYGSYHINPNAKISPDGLKMYQNNGSIFGLLGLKENDMKHISYGEISNDFEFSLKDQLTFAARSEGGIEVLKYNTGELLYYLKKETIVNKLLFREGLIAIYEENGKNYLEYIKNYGPNALAITESSYYPEYGTRADLTNGLKDVPASSYYVFRFNQGIKVSDPSKITLKGPSGLVKANVEFGKGFITISPESLKPSTNYTLTINQGAITGYLGESLSTHTINFSTKALPKPPITSLKVTKSNVGGSPDVFILTATATGGFEPQYKFLVNEDGQWRVLQEYSSNPKYTWKPTLKGDYFFKVMVRSNQTNVEYEKDYEFKESIIDDELPTAYFNRSSSSPTNKNVMVSIISRDNFGVRNIKLPNGEVIPRPTADYVVSTNGTYSFEVRDLFGNVKTEVITVDNIDKVLPHINISVSTTEPTKNNLQIAAIATDNENVKSIKLPNGNIINGESAIYTVSKNGYYTFIVTDTAGNSVSKTINISNIYKTAPTMPSVNTVGNNQSVINGKTIPNSIVTASVSSKVIGSVKSSSSGVYSIKIPQQKTGTKISVYVTDPIGNKSSTKTVIVVDKTPPATPTVNKVTSKSKVMTGKAEKSATVYVYNGTKLINKANVTTSGNFKINISPQKKGTNLKIYVVDKAKNKSKYIMIKVN